MKVYIVVRTDSTNVCYAGETEENTTYVVTESLLMAKDQIERDRLRVLKDVISDEYDLECDWTITQGDHVRYKDPLDSSYVHIIGKNRETNQVKRNLLYEWHIVPANMLSASQSEHSLT